MPETLDQRRERLGDYELFSERGASARLVIGEDGGLIGVGRLHGLIVWSVEIPAEEVRGLRTWLNDVLSDGGTWRQARGVVPIGPDDPVAEDAIRRGRCEGKR